MLRLVSVDIYLGFIIFIHLCGRVMYQAQRLHTNSGYLFAIKYLNPNQLHHENAVLCVLKQFHNRIFLNM